MMRGRGGRLWRVNSAWRLWTGSGWESGWYGYAFNGRAVEEDGPLTRMGAPGGCAGRRGAGAGVPAGHARRGDRAPVAGVRGRRGVGGVVRPVGGVFAGGHRGEADGSQVLEPAVGGVERVAFGAAVAG